MAEDTRVQTPKTLRDLGHALGVHLPRKLALVRKLGKDTRALSRDKPRR